ncbi:MAG: hypothetical protein CBB99_07035 [Bacteroidetes bacterium TMED39]|nr:MAG: hypothetical protein CBB99_07035 [Bacteroidetes bacterium TMED39]
MIIGFGLGSWGMDISACCCSIYEKIVCQENCLNDLNCCQTESDQGCCNREIDLTNHFQIPLPIKLVKNFGKVPYQPVSISIPYGFESKRKIAPPYNNVNRKCYLFLMNFQI